MKVMDWNHIRAFHATATLGSLSAAARHLALTQPTLSRQVQGLEQALGLSLFERRGRRLVLTQAGADLLGHIRLMGDAADSVALTASGRVQEVGGLVSISVTDSYAAYIMPRIVARIRAEAPQITVAIIATNDLSDLHRREADIAIRHAPPERPGLTGEYLGETRAGFYASEEWVALNGLPAGPTGLAGAALIGLEDPLLFAEYLRGIGIPVQGADMRLTSNSSVAVWEMVRRGLGIGAMLHEIAEGTPGVVNVLPDMAPIQVPLWLITHQELQNSPRIRLVLNILADALAREPKRPDANPQVTT
ncbi:LysR family transcriptional regulator [Pararhodobacter sp.]|uniref:LysR family transcriptional regulator n=1 Tax=Pararhodobacter sp. TaxID=2127056 RepID=UPI002FDE7C17